MRKLSCRSAPREGQQPVINKKLKNILRDGSTSIPLLDIALYLYVVIKNNVNRLYVIYYSITGNWQGQSNCQLSYFHELLYFISVSSMSGFQLEVRKYKIMLMSMWHVK